MKLRNVELIYVAENLTSVRKEKIATKISMAVTKSIIALGKANEEYNEARKAVIESYAKKKEDGEFVVIDEEVINNGKKEIAKSYDFDSLELKTECLKKTDELSRMEVEVNLSEITEEDILAEPKLTPDQVNALLILVKQ